MTRCAWATNTTPLLTAYHDTEWGVPLHDDQKLFEFLCLEGAQAGVSWRTILERRENYRQLYCRFDPESVAKQTTQDHANFLANPGIIRNRLKVAAFTKNAKAFLQIQKEYGSFDSYLWQFVDSKPVQNKWQTAGAVPATTPLAERLSRDLKQRGFTFVGPTICYAFMQAVGLINDHTTDCFRYQEIKIGLDDGSPSPVRTEPICDKRQ